MCSLIQQKLESPDQFDRFLNKVIFLISLDWSPKICVFSIKKGIWILKINSEELLVSRSPWHQESSFCHC